MTDTIEDRADDIFHDICDANKHSHNGEGLSILIDAFKAERADMREKAAKMCELSHPEYGEPCAERMVIAQEIRNLD